MKNAARAAEYLAYRKKQEAVFRPDHLQNEKRLTLSPQYELLKRRYLGEVGPYTLHASDNTLIDQTGTAVYSWRNINDDGEFHKIIEHSDGVHYLIFRTDLYGYSVLNLGTLQDFHFIPRDSFPDGETFIWTDVFYNEKNDVLAVSGCYWASPSGILLMDFSHPMEEPGTWGIVHECLENGYDRYDDIELAQWRGMDLVLSALDCETEEKETISIPQEQYMAWLTVQR